jgi:acyl homoserine lactone synthase
LARYRHQLFIEKLGWNLDSRDGMEYDQFDRPDTLYVVARRRGGELIGTARLLSTDRPYLLSEVFPQLLGNTPAPRTLLVWELSRFAAVDFGSSSPAVAHQFASPVALDLLRKALSLASAAGVKRLISVSPLGIERILRNAGIAARRAATPSWWTAAPCSPAGSKCATAPVIDKDPGRWRTPSPSPDPLPNCRSSPRVGREGRAQRRIR